jgi:hypothetical protein
MPIVAITTLPAAIRSTPVPATAVPVSNEVAAFARRRRRRFPLARLVLIAVVLAGPVLGISLVTWGVINARHVTTETRDLNDPTLSDRDRAALDLPSSASTFFGPGAAAAVVRSFDDSIAGPTRFTQISLYSDYAIAVAQDSGRPAHLDQYPWRSGHVGTSSPRPAVDDADALAFTIDQVDWSAISRLAGTAVAVTGVEQGPITHVIVDRSTFDASLPITIRIYVSGPRSSGFIEASATGDVTTVY